MADELLLQRVGRFREAFPDVVATTNLVVANESLVAVNLTARGTHRAIFQGVPATGRSWTATCGAFYRVEDGRISDAWVIWDLMTILEQLGAVRRVREGSA